MENLLGWVGSGLVDGEASARGEGDGSNVGGLGAIGRAAHRYEPVARQPRDRDAVGLIAAENVEGGGVMADIEADMPAALALEDEHVAKRRSAFRNRRAERRSPHHPQ